MSSKPSSEENEDWDAEFGITGDLPQPLKQIVDAAASATPPRTTEHEEKDSEQQQEEQETSTPTSNSQQQQQSPFSGETLHKTRSARAYSRHGRRASFISIEQATQPPILPILQPTEQQQLPPSQSGVTPQLDSPLMSFSPIQTPLTTTTAAAVVVVVASNLNTNPNNPTTATPPPPPPLSSAQTKLKEQKVANNNANSSSSNNNNSSSTMFDETEEGAFERGMAPQKIRGIHANPDKKETFDDDFALPEDSPVNGLQPMKFSLSSNLNASTLDLSLGLLTTEPTAATTNQQQQQQTPTKLKQTISVNPPQGPTLSLTTPIRLTTSDGNTITAIQPQISPLAVNTSSNIQEDRESADIKYLISCLPPIDSSTGIVDNLPVWQICTPQSPLPSWFDEKKPSNKESNIVQALEIWKSALVMLNKTQLADAIQAFTKVQALLEETDPFAREQEFDCFLALVFLHISYAANGMADIFRQTECLKHAVSLLPESTTTTIEASALRAACNYELAVCLHKSNSLSVALGPAVKFLRFTVLGSCGQDHIHSRACVGKAIRWANVARACFLCGSCLPLSVAKHSIAKKCLRKALKAARLVKDDSIISTISPLIENTHPITPQQRVAQTSAFEKTHRRSDSAPIPQQPLVNLSHGGISLQQQQQSQAQQHQHISAGSSRDSGTDTAETERSEAEEDWDAEFGIEPEQRPTTMTFGSILAPIQTTQQAGFSAKHKVLESVLTKPIQLVRFPPPTYLYSMKTSTGFSFFHAEDLEVWLATIVMKHVEANRVFPVRNISSTSNIGALSQSPMAEEQKKFFASINAFPKFSVAWMSRHIMWCQMLLSKGDTETCWETLFAMFGEIKLYVDIVQSNSEKRDKSKLKEMFEMCLEALSLSSVHLWTISRASDWSNLAAIVKSLYPAYASLVDILENEIYAEARMNADDFEMEKWEEANFNPNPVKVLCDIYKKESEKEKKSLSGLSLGTIRSRGPPAAMAEALLAIHCINCGISPLGLVTKSSYEETSFDECSEQSIATSNNRLQALKEIYSRIPEGNTKAKAALILGKAAESSGDWITAEKLFFESVFILDTFSRGVPAIVSELGVKALTNYGDVLLHNSKYQYAISCFEAAILLSDLQKRKDYFALARKVAEIARENDDIERCIGLYNEIINKYLSKGKLNEAVFVSNLLADLHKDRGDFTEAELALTSSCSILLEHNKAKSIPEACSNDPQFFNLQLKLAELFLDSYHFERGIELLEMLNGPTIPKRRRETLLPLLAKSYVKKGWFKDAALAISQMPKEGLAKRKESFSPKPSQKSLPISSSLSGGIGESLASISEYSTPTLLTTSETPNITATESKVNIENIIERLFLVIRAHWSCGKYTTCLFIVDHAIDICPETMLSTRGRLFYRRGRILHQLYRVSDTLKFPSCLKEAVQDIENGVVINTGLIFTTPTDVLQESSASYRKSYQYFLAAGDDTRIARAMALLSKLYLDHIFCAVTIYHSQFEDVSHMPIFKTFAVPCQNSNGECVISLDTIDNPASVALDIATETLDLKILPTTLLNIAELRLLQGDRDSATLYWKECRDLIWQMYMDGPLLILRTCPAYSVGPIVRCIQRLARLLLCLGRDVINQNLVVLDACILSQMDLQQALNRPLRTTYIFNDNNTNSNNSNTNSNESKAITSSNANEEMDDSNVLPSLPSKTIRATPFKPAHINQLPETPLASPSQLASPIRPLPKLGDQSQNQQTTPMLPPKAPQVQTTPTKTTSKILSTPLGSSSGTHSPDECGPVYQHENTAEQIWGLLFCRKNQTTKYANGKLTKNELVTRNQAIMRDILRVTASGRIKPIAASAMLGKGSPNMSSPSRFLPPISPSAARGITQMDPAYRVEEFSTRFPDVMQKLVYVLHLDPILAYYSPLSGQLHFDFFSRKGTRDFATMSAINPTNQNQIGNPPNAPPPRPLLLRVHLLMNPDQYAFLSVTQEATLSELLEEICRIFNEGAPTNSPPPTTTAITTSPSPPPPPPPPTPTPPLQTPQKEPTTPKAPHVKYLGSTQNFNLELAKLAEKLQAESSNTAANPINLHRRSPSGRSRLRPKQLSLAKVPPQQVSGGSGLRFAPLTQPRGAPIGSCFSSKDLHSAEGQPIGLYLYGAISQNAGPTASTQPLCFSSSVSAFLASLIALPNANKSSSSSSSSSAEQTTEEIRATLESINELSTAFNGLIDMLPIRTESPISNSRATTAGSVSANLVVQQTPKSRFSSLREMFSSKEKQEKAELLFSPVSRQPTVLICSPSMQVIPWELVIPDDPVVRYFSFFDLVTSITRTSASHSSNKIRYIPSYVSCYYSTGEKLISEMEDHRRIQLCLDISKSLHLVQPALKQQPSERGRECCIVSFFHSALVEHGKRVSVLKKKYKYVSFFDICKLETDPDEIGTFIERTTVGFFPVLIVTYSDLVEPPEVLAALLRRRPSCVVIAVPNGKLKNVVQRLMHVHEELYKQQQKLPDIRDRYQFLLGSLAILRRGERTIPIAILNPPASFVVPSNSSTNQPTKTTPTPLTVTVATKPQTTTNTTSKTPSKSQPSSPTPSRR